MQHGQLDGPHELLLAFGKHRGRHIVQVDDGYLHWMLSSFPQSSQWHRAAADALKAKTTQREAAYHLLADLKSCCIRRDLQWGCKIQAQAVETGNASNIFVATALINMFAKCGSMLDARRVFDSIQTPDVVAWTAVILGYAANGEGLVSLEMFSKMKADGCVPNCVTYVAALKACASVVVNESAATAQSLEMGRRIHSEIGRHMNLYVQNALIDMYAKCGSMVDARRVFNSVQKPDVVSWNALLLGYAENGEQQVSWELFSKMKADGCPPDSVTFVAVLKACTSLAVNENEAGKSRGLVMGCKLHLEIGIHLDAYVQSTLIDMYAKCGSMLKARQVFDSVQKPDVVSWNALLSGYADSGEGLVTLELFTKMKAGGCAPSIVTYIAALKACTSLVVNGDKAQGLKLGRSIHSEIGSHMNRNVQNTLIDMYAKCGNMLEALLVFESIQMPDVVSWNALLSGYVENGEEHITLELFSKMKAKGCTPDSQTFVALIKACTFLAVNGAKAYGLEMGSKIHQEIGDSLNSYVQNTLIDMYAKCSSMISAQRVFDAMQTPDVVSWNALLLGYVDNGEAHVALNLISKMKIAGCAPSFVTYIAVLKACGSVGALGPGRKLHSEVTEFPARLVASLVDFYARCGSMVEAQAVFDLHSRARDVTTWNALLAGYSRCGDAASVFSLFKAMQDTGLRPDNVTFVCVLWCCSHAGLVTKARQYLEAMPEQYGVTPDVYHYNCMVDVLGRVNQLSEAVSVLRAMPCNLNAVTWSSLLGACCKWRNVEVGRLAFHSLVAIDKKNASAYVFMGQLHSGTS